MQMNLFENIKIFIEIVDAGSFAQAAENLQIHRPAVTKALQQLEQGDNDQMVARGDHFGVRFEQPNRTIAR